MNQLEAQRFADIPASTFQDLEDMLMENIIRHCSDWKQPIASDTWLLKKLAVINRRLGNNDKAAEYYNRLLEADPDNLKLILNVGNILLDSGDLSGALAHYYHANYLQPDEVKIIRAIAYVEFLSGHKE